MTPVLHKRVIALCAIAAILYVFVAGDTEQMTCSVKVDGTERSRQDSIGGWETN